MSVSEGAALRSWVERESCRQTIEIGLAYAVSTLFICQGLLTSAGREGRHVAIDPHQSSGFSDVGLQLLQAAGVTGMVEHHAQRSEDALPELLKRGERFDLAFVDGNHHFDFVFVDLFYLAKLLRPGGIIMLDDHQLPSVARAAAFFITNHGWSIEQTEESPNHDWVALRTTTDPDQRPFGHFVDFRRSAFTNDEASRRAGALGLTQMQKRKSPVTDPARRRSGCEITEVVGCRFSGRRVATVARVGEGLSR